MDPQLSSRLAKNLRRLRLTRGASQAELSRLAGVPRATWTHLESGSGNPTLDVAFRVSQALQVSLEELLATPTASARLYPHASLPHKKKGHARLHDLLPEPPPGVGFDRIELARGAQWKGEPHTSGSQETLTCESGEITLTADNETFALSAGDVVVFRGDQPHSYKNTGRGAAVGYCVVLLSRGAS